MPNPKKTGHAASYRNLGDGPVRDNVTCLVWQRKAAPATYTFKAAKAYCRSLKLAGGRAAHPVWLIPALGHAE